jgi:integrase
MTSPMGRKRTSNFDLPPRMHPPKSKGGCFYYVTTGSPRKWIKLDPDLAKSKVLWAQLEGTETGQGSFITALDEWYAGKHFAGLSEATKIAYGKVREPLRKFFAGGELNGIKPSHVAQWLDNHNSQVMANLGRAVISNIFEIAVRHDKATRNPCRSVKPIAVKSRTRYMTDEEFIAIRAKANDIIRVCMDIGYLTGLRISDILGLKLTDIREDGLYVVQHKTAAKQRYEMTPALRGALDAAKALPRSVRNITHLLCTRKGTQYTYKGINQMFWEAKQLAGITDVRFHDIRAKAATDAKKQGLDYQALLGHATQAMSDKYIRQREFVNTSPLKAKL